MGDYSVLSLYHKLFVGRNHIFCPLLCAWCRALPWPVHTRRKYWRDTCPTYERTSAAAWAVRTHKGAVASARLGKAEAGVQRTKDVLGRPGCSWSASLAFRTFWSPHPSPGFISHLSPSRVAHSGLTSLRAAQLPVASCLLHWNAALLSPSPAHPGSLCPLPVCPLKPCVYLPVSLPSP